MKRFLSEFLYLTQGKYRSILTILFLILISSVLELVGVGIVGPFIAIATSPNIVFQTHWLTLAYTEFNFNSPTQFLVILGFVIVVIFYIKSFLGFYVQAKIFTFGFTLQADLSARLMQAYLKAPYTFHLQGNTATFIQNISTETSKFANQIVMPFLTSISNAAVTFLLILLLIKTNVLAVVVIGGLAFIVFFILRFLRNRMVYWGKEGTEAQAEIIRLINHGLGGLKETRVIGCEDYFIDQVDEQVARYGNNMSLAISFSNLPRYLIEAFLITFLVCFTAVFISFAPNDQNLSAILGVFALASIRLLPASGNLISSLNGIRPFLYSMDRLYFDFKELETFSTKQDSAPKNYSQALGNDSKKDIYFSDYITINAVEYQYPNASQKSLNGIDLKIEKGQSIALIGKSGAGKTTLVDVILGLLIPQSGDIKVDGISIYSDLRSWQDVIGYVPQSIFLIDDTLARNIAFGVPDHLINWNRLLQAVQAAQLSALIEQLSQGLNTRVGERGVFLSGGQRQRVGIARALYHEREILVFDEATAALDNETENLVTESIKSLSGSKTIIIIAHRLSTIEHCDFIYVLESGRVVRSGRYNEVLDKTHYQGLK